MRKLFYATVIMAGTVVQSGYSTAVTPLTVDAVRKQLTASHYTFTEKNEEDAAKMRSSNLIARAVKFKVPAPSGHHVTVLALELKSPADKAAVKSELEGQFAAVRQASSSTIVKFLQEAPNALMTISYHTEDQNAGKKVEADLK